MKHLMAGCFGVGILLIPVNGLALDVLVNQVGFAPNSPKVFRAQRSSDYAGSGTFSIRRKSDSVDVYTGTLTRKGALWNKWYWEGDFSSFQIPGDYYLTASVSGENGSSYDFTIGHDILLNQTGTLTYQYFWTQRCGVAVSGWHGVCHADDGLRSDNSQHIDVTGGWHDSGEYNKYADGYHGDAVFDLCWLYESNPSYYDAIDTNGNGVADLIDEILQGAHWLVKMVQPDGYVLHNTRKRRSGTSWVRPENDTNNIIGDSDDRWVDPGTDDDHPQAIMVCAALIKTHQVLAAKGLPTENFAAKALLVWNHRVAYASAHGHNNLGNEAAQPYAGLALYSVFGQQDCYDRALQSINDMSNTIIANPAFYDPIGWDVGPGRELGILAWFARTYPSTYPANNARNAVQALMSHNLDLANDPIGLIRRDDNGTLQYFQSNPDPDAFYLGINRLYLLMAWGSIEAYKLIGDAAYLRFAVDQYNWVMGANYNRVCMMEEAGDFNLPKYSSRYNTIPGHSDGAQPGVVPNGYIRVYSTGLPYIDLSTDDWKTNEGWVINNSAYAMALSAMNVFRDAATYISDTIPTQMYPSQTYSVSVTMKNSSYMPWDRERYKLGAVDDSDPFAAGRQLIAEGVTVGPGQTYTWTFNMTAPVTPNTYTTDWRMVHENVCWFGDTLTKQVQVVTASAPGPVSNFIATAGDKQIALSWTNPSSFNFTGTLIRYSTVNYPTSPSDGLLLVDKANTPGSGDNYVHSGLTNGITVYYSAFAHDSLSHYASMVSISSMPLAPSDFDHDGDVDQEDFGYLQTCLSGPSRPYPAGCSNADFDGDNDVDQNDFGLFQQCMAGPNQPLGC